MPRLRVTTATLLSALLTPSLALETTTTPSGLVIDRILTQSCTRPTRKDDTISVHYRGSLLDGTVFDESYSRHVPITFVLGQHHVIDGWDQGLSDMCIGDERNLTIPAGLAYGRNAVGSIPANSVLRFETKLMGIEGVETPVDAVVVPPPSVNAEGPGDVDVASEVDAWKAEMASQSDDTARPDAATPECRLLGPFALIVQAALGLIALLSLVFKRWREHPRRPLQVWFFDASKQVVGTAMLHVLNLAISMFSSQPGAMSAASNAKVVAQRIADGTAPNPCSFYLLNLAIDTTIGIPVLVILLRVLHALFLRTPLASPPESIKSGNYGHPPRISWWIKQCTIYFLGLFGMKLFVFFLFAALPWLAYVGDWALRWTEGDEGLQIAFVMFICPVLLNAVQYYVIDGFIMDKEHEGKGYEGLAQEESQGETDELGRPTGAGEGESQVEDDAALLKHQRVPE